jgi:hypothetical protein
MAAVTDRNPGAVDCILYIFYRNSGVLDRVSGAVSGGIDPIPGAQDRNFLVLTQVVMVVMVVVVVVVMVVVVVVVVVVAVSTACPAFDSHVRNNNDSVGPPNKRSLFRIKCELLRRLWLVLCYTS